MFWWRRSRGVEGGEVVERVFETGRDGVLFVTSNGAEEALASGDGALPHLPANLLVGGSDFGEETTPLVVAVVSGGFDPHGSECINLPRERGQRVKTVRSSS